MATAANFATYRSERNTLALVPVASLACSATSAAFSAAVPRIDFTRSAEDDRSSDSL
jgi:hypothetical protein